MSWNLETEDGAELAKVLNFTPALDRAKILTRLYNGDYMAQTVGKPSARPSATILVDGMDALRAVNEAETTCALLKLTYKETTYTGYIAEAPKWTAVIRGRVYTASISFAVRTEAPE